MDVKVTGFSVHRPVTIVIFYLLLMGVAAILVPRLAVDLYPEVSPPVLSVFANYPGAGPEDVEKNVTEILEKALATVEGLEEISSTSAQGSSRIFMEFSFRTDLDEAKAEIDSLLARLSGALPDDAETPVSRKFDLSMIPIMNLAISGDQPLEKLKQIAEDEIQPKLERIEGVASTEVRGGSDRIVKVAVSQNRLAAFGLTIGGLVQTLRGQNVLVSGGSLIRGNREYQIRTQEELDSLEEVRRIVVSMVRTDSTGPGGADRSRFVRLEDVADVSLAYDESRSRVYVNGKPGIYIRIQNESDSNSVKVAGRIRDSLGDINAGLPPGLSVEVLRDNTAMINATLNQVYTSAYQGILLAMAVLFLFLRNLRGTFIIGLAIPISILITLMCMSIFNLTLNLLTLTGLILGLGMTVDSSIVILENIFQYRERGAKPSVAAVLGSQEMIRAITASTVTTLCVFIPVVIFQNELGMMGQMFRDLVFTVVISLISSLLVAVTLVPALAGPIMKLSTRTQKPMRIPVLRGLDKLFERFFAGMERGYKKVLDNLLDNRILFIVLIISVLLFAFLQFSTLGMNLFVRSRTDDEVRINLTMPLGTPKERTEEVILDMKKIAEREIEGYRNIVVTVAGSSFFGGSRADNTARLDISLPEPKNQIDTPASIMKKLGPRMNGYPGADFSFSAGRRMGSASAVDIKILTKNIDTGLETAEEIRSILLRHLPRVENPSISMEEGGPELQVDIDRNRAQVFGISLYEIAAEIRRAMYGEIAAVYDNEGDLINVVVALAEKDRDSLEDLSALFLVNRYGIRVSLYDLVRVKEGKAPTEINREQLERVIHVTGDLAQGIAITEFQEALENVISENLTPREGVQIRYGGEAQEIEEFGTTFIWIILAAVFLVFGVMASQFESFVDPFIIFFSIPLLALGVVGIYKLSGEPFSLFSAVGVVALIGIVVNNGIVLVDYTNLLRARGYSIREACLEAGKNRLRPILMTSLTTILGMVPLAFFPGAGAETIQPIGKTLVGGLAVSSILTPFVTPVLYSILNRRHDQRKRRKEEAVREKLAAEIECEEGGHG